jgi:hypothetical protein
MIPLPAVIHWTSPASMTPWFPTESPVLHAAVEHDGHGFEAAVRMLRETRNPGLRIIGSELIEHQKRIDHVQGSTADHSLEFHAGAIGGRHAGDFLAYISHRVLRKIGTLTLNSSMCGHEGGFSTRPLRLRLKVGVGKPTYLP